MSDKLTRARQTLAAAEQIAVLTGAGMSTEASIPDFRSTTGLYSRRSDYPPEYLLSINCLDTHPELFFDYVRTNLNFQGVQPDAAYRLLAKLEQRGRVSGIITQNIDGLHAAAGSQRVLEAHGSLARFYCTDCGRGADATEQLRPQVPFRCDCGGLLRPDVVLYGEALPNVDAAFELADDADALLVLGTSLVVYPIAAIPQRCLTLGKPVVIVNRDATGYEHVDGVIELHTSIGDTLPRLFAD
ncbi:NAD-dependent protein deacylase [uncultured Gulosibacter sp.]|uniref:NAD-dependent protein deacylase n=1 Tax=uncultured Gulosibacter sp. TaxID=1339167 RepID=UPI00288C0C8B|nr:NAD-dependent protein deacylase [uncultured Gulosibacter sp.]